MMVGHRTTSDQITVCLTKCSNGRKICPGKIHQNLSIQYDGVLQLSWCSLQVLLACFLTGRGADSFFEADTACVHTELDKQKLVVKFTLTLSLLICLNLDHQQQLYCSRSVYILNKIIILSLARVYRWTLLVLPERAQYLQAFEERDVRLLHE